MVDMEMMCELASAIVERQWYKNNLSDPSFTASNGDIVYKEEVQDEFGKVLDIIDDILNGDK